jgi:hypothetical protein
MSFEKAHADFEGDKAGNISDSTYLSEMEEKTVNFLKKTHANMEEEEEEEVVDSESGTDHNQKDLNKFNNIDTDDKERSNSLV